MIAFRKCCVTFLLVTRPILHAHNVNVTRFIKMKKKNKKRAKNQVESARSKDRLSELDRKYEQATSGIQNFLTFHSLFFVVLLSQCTQPLYWLYCESKNGFYIEKALAHKFIFRK